MKQDILRTWVWTSRLLLLGMAGYFFVTPAWVVLDSMGDPGLRGDGIPKVAWDLHRNLSPRYEVWARERVAENGGGRVDQFNISGTE